MNICWSELLKGLGVIAGTISSLGIIFAFIAAIGILPITHSQAEKLVEFKIEETQKEITLAAENNYKNFRRQQQENTKKLIELDKKGSVIQERTESIQKQLKEQKDLSIQILREMRNR